MSSETPLHQPAAARARTRWQRAFGRSGHAWAVRGISRGWLARLASYPDAILRSPHSQTIKTGRTAQVVRTEIPVEGTPCRVALKRILRRTWIKRLTTLVTEHPARRAFRLGHWLLEHGVRAARPLAVVVPPRWQPNRPAWLLTEWLDGTCNLHQFAVAQLGQPTKQKALHSGAVSAGKLIGRLHAAGGSHRDLKPGNLLVRETETGVETLLVDLDGISLHPRVAPGRKVRNLGRLAEWAVYDVGLRPTVLLRFVKSYLAASAPDTAEAVADWKPLWRAIAANARRRRSRRKTGLPYRSPADPGRRAA